MTTETSIEIELDSAVGPRVIYVDGTTEDEIGAELPSGWAVDYSSQVRTDSGRWSCPLVAVTTTYSINCTDTDDPTAWMATPGIVTMRPGNQDSGRCAWTVVTTQPERLEAALDADETVLEYEAVES